MEYYHIDVFAGTPMNGNGLAVVFVEHPLEDHLLLRITQEFRQFETIFVHPEADGRFPVRIFTMEEELAFAGHPILGAAGAIFLKSNRRDRASIDFLLGDRTVRTRVRTEQGSVVVTMNQGAPEFLRQVTPAEAADILVSMNLETGDLAGEYPMEVVTTGLPYLLIPVRNPEVLSRARISTPDLQRQLQEVGAGFVYLCEPESLECRTWDNLGHVEDVATGSAAGPFGAYLVRYGRISLNETAKIHQGRFVGRPCEIETWVDEDSGDVMIQGAVSVFATGRLEVV